jgi:hypothetical protein
MQTTIGTFLLIFLFANGSDVYWAVKTTEGRQRSTSKASTTNPSPILGVQLEKTISEAAIAGLISNIMRPQTSPASPVHNSIMTRRSQTKTSITDKPSIMLSPNETDIAQVVDASQPGTTFIFLPGVYKNLSIAAKTGNTFTGAIGSDGSRQTISTGAQVLSGFILRTDGAWVATTTQVKPGQFAGYCQSAYPSCRYDEDLFYDGQPYLNMTAGGSPSTLDPGQYFFDYATGTIYVRPINTSDNPNQHQVEYNSTRSAITGTDSSNVTIQNIVVEHYASPNQMGAIGDQYPGTNWIINNVEVRWNHGTGVRLASGASLTNSYIHDNGQKGVGGNGGNILVDSNEIAHNVDYNGTDCDWESAE